MKEELLEVMPPPELTLQVPQARTTFSARRGAPRTGTAAAKPTLAAKIAANAAVAAAAAEKVPLGADAV